MGNDPRLGTSPRASTHSLHSLQEDEDDLPPSYTDVITEAETETDRTVIPTSSNRNIDNRDVLTEDDYFVPGAKRVNDKRTISLSPNLCVDNRVLHNIISEQAKLPPRPLLVVEGTHQETRNNNSDNNKNGSQKENVVDFRFRVDLTSVLKRLEGWHTVSVVGDGDGMEAFRGGRWRSTESGVMRGEIHRGADAIDDGDDVENAAFIQFEDQDQDQDGSKPGLMGWCERFCNDPAPVKSFTLTRKMHGLDVNVLRTSLASQIRELNYRGHINIWLCLAHSELTVYSPHWINRLRHNSFVWWACVILQLWILTWPTIWLLERRYGVIESTWYASQPDECPLITGRTRRRYAQGRSEAQLAAFWAPAVKLAAWHRRKDGEVLTEEEAQRLQGLRTEQVVSLAVGESVAERERRERVDRGDGTFADSVVGLVRGVSEVRQNWNMAMGWGGDS